MIQLDKRQKEMLLEAAWQGRAHSYSPYSHFAVGAAVLGENGKIYKGCNVENASYGLTNCAERTAIFSMVADGCPRFTAIAVVTGSDTITPPCGACRQVISELSAGPQTPVILSNGRQEQIETAAGLLPYGPIGLEPDNA